MGMPNESAVIGGISEITAARALLANGWQIAKPFIPESFDLIGRHKVTGECRTFQVKTIYRRTDRKNEYVISGKKGNGNYYSKSDCDYLLGVAGNTVYMTECTGYAEYWASESTVNDKWINLSKVEVSVNAN